jgi:chemotaxis protein MotB
MLKRSLLALTVAVAVLAFAGCANKTAELKKQNASLAQSLKEQEGQLDSLRSKLEALETQKRQADEKLTLAEKEKRRLQDELAKRSSEQDALERQRAELENMVKNLAGISVEGRPDGNFIVIENQILFESGKADLTGQGKGALQKVSDYLKRHPKQMIRIDGHTDSDPIKASGWKSNFHLAAMRSHSVLDALKGEGVDPGRMYIVGFGVTQPAVWPEKTPKDKAKNRRVEILMIPERPKLSEKILENVD